MFVVVLKASGATRIKGCEWLGSMVHRSLMPTGPQGCVHVRRINLHFVPNVYSGFGDNVIHNKGSGHIDTFDVSNLSGSVWLQCPKSGLVQHDV